MPTSVSPAPGDLEFVRQFVNTLDVEAGTDQLEDPATYQAWALTHGVDDEATQTEMTRAREFREALRAALLANHERAPLPQRTVDSLNAASQRARLIVHFTAKGTSLVSEASGADLLLGRVVAAVLGAMADTTWQRLKVCAADTCQWGFYDTSRSRTGQWCSMSICGNRAKQARYRNASRDPHPSHDDEDR